MSHFCGIVFGDSISEVLAPYSENLEVEQYIDKTAEELIEWAKKRERSLLNYITEHKDDPEDSYEYKKAQDFIEYLESYNNFSTKEDYLHLIEKNFDLDANGNSISTYNPNSKWDWYEEGGRWSGEILHAGSYDTNQARIEDLTKIGTPFCFIDLDGEWHERGSMGWWGMSYDEKDDGTWETEFREYLKTLPEDTLVTVIDFHI